MVVIATQKELDWLFDVLGAAGLCPGCPARPYCNPTDEEMAQIDDAIRRALGLEEEAPRNAYDPKPWRDVRRAAETDQLEEQLAEAKEQAESWRRMALHLMERSA